MKILQSLFTRRQFLNGLLGGWAAALGASFLGPIFKCVIPPYQEPDEVILLYADFEDIEPNTTRSFPWGSKPGIIKRTDNGNLEAYVAVCTHLDCNVSYLPEQRKFFCACHDGWYDEDGINIQGPPPTPLRRLNIIIEGENLIVRRPELE